MVEKPRILLVGSADHPQREVADLLRAVCQVVQVATSEQAVDALGSGEFSGLFSLPDVDGSMKSLV